MFLADHSDSKRAHIVRNFDEESAQLQGVRERLLHVRRVLGNPCEKRRLQLL